LASEGKSFAAILEDRDYKCAMYEILHRKVNAATVYLTSAHHYGSAAKVNKVAELCREFENLHLFY